MLKPDHRTRGPQAVRGCCFLCGQPTSEILGIDVLWEDRKLWRRRISSCFLYARVLNTDVCGNVHTPGGLLPWVLAVSSQWKTTTLFCKAAVRLFALGVDFHLWSHLSPLQISHLLILTFPFLTSKERRGNVILVTFH